jgi:hypothetical protein
MNKAEREAALAAFFASMSEEPVGRRRVRALVRGYQRMMSMVARCNSEREDLREAGCAELAAYALEHAQVVRDQLPREVVQQMVAGAPILRELVELMQLDRPAPRRDTAEA